MTRISLLSLGREAAATAAKSLQWCPTLCDPIDGSPPGSPVPGILQARTLEWVAISSSNAWKWKVKVKSLSRVRLFATPWTAAYQAPPSMGFSRQEYWSGVPFPSPVRRGKNNKTWWCFLEGEDVVKFANYPVCVVARPSVPDSSSHLFQVYFVLIRTVSSYMSHIFCSVYF